MGYHKLESFQMILKVSRLSGKFKDHLESFQTIWKVSRPSVKFPGHLESFQAIWIVSRPSGNLCIFACLLMVDFIVTRKNFPGAQKLSGWQCHHKTWLFLPLMCTPLLQQGVARNWKFQFEIWLEAVLLISNTAVQWWASRQWIPNIRKLPFLSFYSENSFKSLERNSDEKKRNSRAPSVLGSAFNQLPTRSDFLPLLGFLRWNAPAAVTSDGNVQHLFKVNSFPREELGQDIFSGRNEKKYVYLNGKFRRNYP